MTKKENLYIIISPCKTYDDTILSDYEKGDPKMGHDILMFNKKGKEIGYLRFSMYDRSADAIYDIFNVKQFNGFVSGKGDQKTFSKEEIRAAYENYQTEKPSFTIYKNEKYHALRRNEIDTFIQTSVNTVKEEGEVTIFFG